MKNKKILKHEGTNNFFRKGKSGDWKNHFDDDVKKLFKSKAGNLLIELGYEDDLDWEICQTMQIFHKASGLNQFC